MNKTNRIAECRKVLGLTQKDLCEAIGDGWGQSRLSMYELGNNEPSLPDCRKIVAGLNAKGGSFTLDFVFPPEQETTSKPESTAAA